mmetsp:Transcript_471/g.951  ORF Transcript_471/g.951 Transcript_471/m.951 type:complete len:231 (-) Transcript_471:2114-2806(-)
MAVSRSRRRMPPQPSSQNRRRRRNCRRRMKMPRLLAMRALLHRSKLKARIAWPLLKRARRRRRRDFRPKWQLTWMDLPQKRIPSWSEKPVQLMWLPPQLLLVRRRWRWIRARRRSRSLHLMSRTCLRKARSRRKKNRTQMKMMKKKKKQQLQQRAANWKSQQKCKEMMTMTSPPLHLLRSRQREVETCSQKLLRLLLWTRRSDLPKSALLPKRCCLLSNCLLNSQKACSK